MLQHERSVSYLRYWGRELFIGRSPAWKRLWRSTTRSRWLHSRARVTSSEKAARTRPLTPILFYFRFSAFAKSTPASWAHSLSFWRLCVKMKWSTEKKQ